LVFSWICRHCGNHSSSDEILQRCGQVLVKTFQHLGAAPSACFAKPNDISIAGKKVAGLTLTDWYGVRSFSGAILIDVDVETMAALLTPSGEKLGKHGIQSLRERVSSLRHCLKSEVTPQAVMTSLINAFAAESQRSFFPDYLSNRELDIAESLKKQKYGNAAWNTPSLTLEAL